MNNVECIIGKNFPLLLLRSGHLQPVANKPPRFVELKRYEKIPYREPLPEFGHSLDCIPQSPLAGENKCVEIIILVGEIDQNPQLLEYVFCLTEHLPFINNYNALATPLLHIDKRFLEESEIFQLIVESCLAGNGSGDMGNDLIVGQGGMINERIPE